MSEAFFIDSNTGELVSFIREPVCRDANFQVGLT
jgi:hypothetical protein